MVLEKEPTSSVDNVCQTKTPKKVVLLTQKIVIWHKYLFLGNTKPKSYQVYCAFHRETRESDS